MLGSRSQCCRFITCVKQTFINCSSYLPNLLWGGIYASLPKVTTFWDSQRYGIADFGWVFPDLLPGEACLLTWMVSPVPSPGKELWCMSWRTAVPCWGGIGQRSVSGSAATSSTWQKWEWVVERSMRKSSHFLVVGAQVVSVACEFWGLLAVCLYKELANLCQP